MEESRRKVQAKLRRKYKYSTNTNYGRGMVLIKPPGNSVNEDYINIVCDRIVPYLYPEVNIFKGDDYLCGMSYEELELICEAVKQFRTEVENDNQSAERR